MQNILNDHHPKYLIKYFIIILHLLVFLQIIPLSIDLQSTSSHFAEVEFQTHLDLYSQSLKLKESQFKN